MTRRSFEPRVAVFCRCGAQWFGRYAVDNPAIGYHARRCGPAIDAAAFAALGFTARPPAAWKREQVDAARDLPPGAPR